MIGFQQQQQQADATGRSSMAPARGSSQRAHLPQLSQHCHHQTASPLIKMEPRQPASSPSPSPTSRQTPVSQTHLSDFKSHHRKGSSSASSASSRRVSSSGYHSAASSPGSSVSSPVSSSASTGSSSAVSSASGRGGAGGQRQLASPTCSFSSSLSSSSGLMATMSPSASITRTTANVLVPASSPLTATAAETATPSSGSFPPVHPQDLGRANPTNYSHHQAGAHVQRAPTHASQSPGGAPNLLDYFPETQQDGANLSWFHGANSRQALGQALASGRLVVSGDISLAEMSRYPVPIMARPPLGASDLTLENWLTDVIRARRGIKLTFTSTRTVEPAFRVLARHAEHLKGPIILSADILARPQFGQPKQPAGGQQTKQQPQLQQPVDAWTFLMLCRTRFPKSIISIGWCAAQVGCRPEFSAHAVDSGAPAESMFEFEMMLDQQQQSHHFSQPLLHLSAEGAPPSSQQRTSLSSLSVVQQLAAVAVAAAASSPQHTSLNPNHHHVHRLAANPNPPRHHYVLSSGSLNSSSGNSSGSPSPTSPIGHLLSPAQHAQLQRHHFSLAQHQQHQPASTEQLIFAADIKSSCSPASALAGQAAGWPAVAAASSLKQHQDEAEEEEADGDEAEAGAKEEEEQEEEGEEEDEDEDEDEDEQLPLNLNINEADPQHSTLSELAQKIHSLQQQSNNLNQLTSSLSGGHQQQSAVALTLASKLFSGSAASAAGSTDAPPLPSTNGDHPKWEHISKKAAVANRLHSNSPSPVSTSPKSAQHHALGGNLLSCVKPGGLGPTGSGHAYQQPAKFTLSPAHNSHSHNYGPGRHAQPLQQPPLAYTREMIDKMASLVKEYNLTQPVTFPVEARGVLGARNANSLAELQRLLYQVGSNSSLTLVAQQEDLISVDELLALRKQFGSNQILFDLPDQLADQLRHELEMRL